MRKACFWMLLFFCCLSCAYASPSYFFNPYHNNCNSVRQQESEKKIESYLLKQVPGLRVSYRDVIDAMIAEGFNVFLKGGVIRDLVSEVPSEPQDIDLGYSGTPDQLEKLLIKKRWMYTRKPEGWMIIIGDHRSSYIEAVPIISQDFGEDSNDYKEFTLNSIFYHCNTRRFLSSFDRGLRDLARDRLKIFSSDWQKWLQSTVVLKYYKIFRFWKMVGKGYVFEAGFGRFIEGETKRCIIEDQKEFSEQLLHYLGRHFHSFDDVVHGSVAIMGYEWAEKHILPLKERARINSLTLESERDRYTYFSSAWTN